MMCDLIKCHHEHHTCADCVEFCAQGATIASCDQKIVHMVDVIINNYYMII
jgi:hypothetical protein